MLRNIRTVFIYAFAVIGFILVVGYGAVRFGFTNTPGIIDRQSDFFQKKTEAVWSVGEEWETFKTAVLRDKDSILKAGKDSSVRPRLIFSLLAVEQLRLYHTNRALFKEAFAPLKLLGNQSQFSWGVMGIKQETAIEIEKHLKDTASPYYPGTAFEKLLDFETPDRDTERFNRIIDENNRYYSYLYAGLYIREIETQWKRAGFDISNRPEILATLFNIGFEHSNPNSNPQTGGSAIEINGKTYSFGGLAGEIYFSDELLTELPR